MTGLRVDVHMPLKGRFKFVAIRPDGTQRLLADWFDNLIVDQGLDMLGDSATWPNSIGFGCSVGSGNTPPASTDTTIETFVGGTVSYGSPSNSSGSSGGAPWYVYHIVTYEFAAGVATGNLSEVCVNYGTQSTGSGGAGNSAAKCFSRALIVDGGGSPTTITVLSDEILHVIWELRYYAPIADITGTDDLTIYGSPVSTNWVLRAAKINSALSDGWAVGGIAVPKLVQTNPGSEFLGAGAWNGTLGAVTANPSGTSASTTSVGNSTYSDGDFFKDFTANFAIASANLSGGISAVCFNPNGTRWQMSLSPAVPKTNVDVFSITMRLSWANL